MTISGENQAKTLGDWAYIGINKHFQKILRYKDGVLEDRDIEDLHQMRVGMRRLRSTMTGFSLALILPKEATEQKVGKLARVLGKLRDLDVLGWELTHNYEPHLPKKEGKIFQDVKQVLARQRQEAWQEVKLCLEGKLYQTFSVSLESWLENPRYQPVSTVEITTVLADLLLPQASRLLLHPGWWVGIGGENLEWETILAKEGLILHDLRKEAKRSRYNMELFANLYQNNYGEYLQDIKEIQSILGEIQDSFVLGEFLRDTYGKNWQVDLPTLVAKFQEVRQQKWEQWRPLQSKFLEPSTRKDLHLTILNHGSIA